VFAALGEIGAVEVGQKLMLLAIVFLAGWGMHRLVRPRFGRDAPALFAGVLYAVNPFVYDRLFTGQWFLLLGYALLPLAYRAFLATLERDRGAPWRFGALFVATGIASTHMAALLAVLCAATLIASARRIRRTPRVGRAAAAALALGVLPSLYWLIPTPGLEDFWRHVGSGQLALYRTVPDGDWGLGATVAGLYGYWNDAEPVKFFLTVWPLLAAALIALAAWGAALRRRDPITWAVAGAGVFGFLLALGDGSALTRDTYTWLLDHFSALRSFREPQKGVALLVFAYAFLGAAAVDDLLSHPPRLRWARTALAVAVVVLPLMYGYRMLGGLWGGLETSHFPASWDQADATLEAQASHSRTLFLPWHGYFALDFAHGRVVANPAASFFHTPILASRSVGDAAVADESDPTERRVQRLLARPGGGRDLARCLAPLGVSHVLLAKQADWQRYRFLDRRSDFAPVRRWNDLTLYRSRTPGGFVMAANGTQSACSGKLRPLDVRKRSEVRYELAQQPPARSEPVLGLPQPAKWRASGNEVTFAPWSRYRRNYLLGVAGALAFAASWMLLGRRRKPPT
jgi:hypothetical protein